MTKHQKPTKEELQENLKEFEDITEEDLTKSQEEESEESEEEHDEASEVDDTPDEEGQEEEATEAEAEDEEQAEPSKELYKKKFSESSRENQKIHAKNRVINQALIEADEIPEPTEEELVKEYPDWELMTDIEKTLAKETVVSRNWRKVISQAKEQATKIEKWVDSVDEFIEDPKTLVDNPELEGKTDEFRQFATEETNNSVPFKILVSAFLHETSTNKKSNKGRMFERAKGGSNEKPKLKNGMLTIEEGRQLRESNYDLWKEKLKAGKIQKDF